MQHLLKATSGAAGIVPAKFLDKLLPAVDYAGTSLDVSFGREPLAAFAAGFVEKSCCSRQSFLSTWTCPSHTESELPVNSTPCLAFDARNGRPTGLREKRRRLSRFEGVERRRPRLTSPIEVRPLLLRSSSRRPCGSADAFVRRTQARPRGNSQVVRPPPNSR
jgi:hypothetical protein